MLMFLHFCSPVGPFALILSLFSAVRCSLLITHTQSLFAP